MKKLLCVLAIMLLTSICIADPIMDGLKAEMEEFNKTLPLQVDSITRLDVVTVGPGKRIVYHYAVVGLDATVIDKTAFINLATKQIKKTACKSDEAKMFGSMDITMEFEYRDESGELFGTVIINKEVCGK